MKSFRQTFIEWVKEWKLGILLIANTIIFSIYLYYDLNLKTSIGNREIIGNLTYKFNQIERKFNKEMAWDSLDSQSVVTNLDSVRSGKNSVAVIKLKDGTEIEMDQESMIILELTSKTKKVSFEKGSINVKKTPVEGESGQITVESKNGKVLINDGDVIFGTEKQDKLAVAVARGTAEVVLDGKSIELKENQVLTSTPEGDLRAKQQIVRMESPVERTNRMEKKILESQKALIRPTPIEEPSQEEQPEIVSKKPEKPKTAPIETAFPTGPVRPTVSSTTISSSSSENSSSKLPKSQPASQYSPPKPSSLEGKAKETEQDRRKKDQEALQRFLKM